MSRIGQAGALAFEQFELVVELFDETAGISSIEIVENTLPPVVQGVEELMQTIQARRLDLLGPALKAALAGSSIRSMVKDCHQ